MKKNIKITIGIILLIILGVVGKYYYDYCNNQKVIDQEEQENIKIDEYNFEQLEKVKTILDPLDRNSYSFRNLKQFNEQFNQNITPIKNCYFLSDRNRYFDDKKGGGGYIFGSELYSEKYIKIYGESYIAYPKYDLPFSPFCDGGDYCDTDFNLMVFGETISTPCKE